MKINEEQLAEINRHHEGKEYIDKDAAKSNRGNTKKTALTSSPFVLEFEYGANAEGYWVYEHMVLQLEDCVDCLKVLYPEIDVGTTGRGKMV